MRFPIKKKSTGEERTYDAVVEDVRHGGVDAFNQQIIQIRFKIKVPGKRAQVLTKRYFGPFTPGSALIRDLRRIKQLPGPKNLKVGYIDSKDVVNARCRVKVMPGMRFDWQIVVLPPRTT